MSFNEFQSEVRNNRPRMALFYLEPVIKELIDRIDQLESHCCKCDVPSEPEPAPVKKAAAKKKAAAPKVEAESKAATDIEK